VAGAVRRRGVSALEEELGGGGVKCRIRREWDQKLEKGGLLHLAGDPGAVEGAEWVLEEDFPEFRWGLGSQ